MEIGKRVMQILKMILSFFHDPRHFCTFERNAVVTQHLTSRPKYWSFENQQL